MDFGSYLLGRRECHLNYTRTDLMDYFGAQQRNTVWSWCGINETKKQVYFSAWLDFKNLHGEKPKPYYTIQEPDWGVKEDGSFQPARNDHDEKLALVFDEGYEALIYFIEAEHKDRVPREIKTTKTSFVFTAELERLADGTVIGYPVDRINVK